MVRAWYLDETAALCDPKKPNMTSESVTLTTLKSFGVNYWLVDSDNYSRCSTLADIKVVKSYDYEDQVTLTREKFPNYDEMMGRFYTEHIHADDEARLCVEGSGFFDVRDPWSDRWIRIEAVKNDMLCIPAGLYHRFTLDDKDMMVCNRYFSGSPVWTAYFRPQENNPVRLQYVSSIGLYRSLSTGSAPTSKKCFTPIQHTCKGSTVCMH